MSYTIKAYKASANSALCDMYALAHISVLADFGITNVTSNTDSWKNNEFAYFLMCFDNDDGSIVGGVRIEVFDGTNYPPLCEAVADMDAGVYEELDKEYGKGTGEICGLWSSNRVMRHGFGTVLTRAGVAFATQLGLRSIFCITAQFNIKMVRDIGFREIVTLGNEGYFPYPNDLYQASVLKIANIETLEDSNFLVKPRILSLRENPLQRVSEQIYAIPLDIQYNLVLSPAVKSPEMENDDKNSAPIIPVNNYKPTSGPNH